MASEARAPKGHPIELLEIDAAAVPDHGHLIEAIYRGELTGVVVRGAFAGPRREVAVKQLASPALADRWDAPNAGMKGGEIRTIGDAATPTFTHLRGPSPEFYAASAARHAENTQTVFGELADGATDAIARVLGGLFGGRPAGPPRFDDALDWAPYNYRALDPGEQIYTHHDNHYGLSVYEKMPADLDRGGLLSWFVTLQAPAGGGELVIYSLWGSDPNPPMLPSRFLDTAALERDYGKQVLDLKDGDLIVFDAGRHVHRVTPVEGPRPRLTLGGFLTLAEDRSRLAFWS